MGYRKNLNQALDDKGMTVRDLCRQTDISPTTIYSIIQRDSSVRYDFALRIANVLDIDIKLICKDNPFEQGEELPAFPDNLNGLLDASQIKRYANNMMLPLLSLCGRDELTKLHELMSDYYVLNDEGRKQMFTMMDMLKNTYTDSERKKALKSIKNGKIELFQNFSILLNYIKACKKAPEENLESLDFTVLQTLSIEITQ